MMTTVQRTISVFCVDDNPLVLEALKLYFTRQNDFEWSGCAHHADGLIEHAMQQCPEIVLLDIDMPGKNPFDAIGELTELCRHSRVLMYTGLIRRELIDRALDSGAWGYVAKTDGDDELFQAIRAVASGSLGFSSSIQRLMG
jgi:DNA-binding NarL/FixJ family response regulator